MSVYTGWQDDLLTVAKLPRTAQNRAFLTAWHTHADSDCDLNPIDLSAKNSGSKRCEASSVSGITFQRYTDRVWARTAFAAQIKEPEYAAIRGALETGDPLSGDNHEALITQLRSWGSVKFGDYVAGAVAAGGTPQTLKAPHALGGWKDLRKSINRGMPDALHHAQSVNRATLRSLARARKVRL